MRFSNCLNVVMGSNSSPLLCVPPPPDRMLVPSTDPCDGRGPVPHPEAVPQRRHFPPVAQAPWVVRRFPEKGGGGGLIIAPPPTPY